MLLSVPTRVEDAHYLELYTQRKVGCRTHLGLVGDVVFLPLVVVKVGTHVLHVWTNFARHFTRVHAFLRHGVHTSCHMTTT